MLGVAELEDRFLRKSLRTICIQGSMLQVCVLEKAKLWMIVVLLELHPFIYACSTVN